MPLRKRGNERVCGRIVVEIKKGKVVLRNCRSPAVYCELVTGKVKYPMGFCRRHLKELNETLLEYIKELTGYTPVEHQKKGML